MENGKEKDKQRKAKSDHTKKKLSSKLAFRATLSGGFKLGWAESQLLKEGICLFNMENIISFNKNSLKC
jgi:hypothetical protein